MILVVGSGVGITPRVVLVATAVTELSVDTPGIGDEAAGVAVDAGKGVVDIGVATGPGADSVEGRRVNDLARPGDVDWLGAEAVVCVVGKVLGVADGDNGSAVEAVLSPRLEVLDTPVVLAALSVEAEGVKMIDVVGVTAAVAALAVEAVDAARVVVLVAFEAVGWV